MEPPPARRMAVFHDIWRAATARRGGSEVRAIPIQFGPPPFRHPGGRRREEAGSGGVGGEGVEVELDPVSGSVGGDGAAVLEGQGFGEEAFEPEPVELEPGTVWYRRRAGARGCRGCRARSPGGCGPRRAAATLSQGVIPPRVAASGSGKLTRPRVMVSFELVQAVEVLAGRDR